MLSSESRFEIPNGSKYLQQLCKHFGHKVAVEFDDNSGHADLPPGRATLVADDAGLNVVVTAKDEKRAGRCPIYRRGSSEVVRVSRGFLCTGLDRSVIAG